MVNHLIDNHSQVDEMELCFPLIKDVLEKFPKIKTTWFIRIDAQIKTLYENPLFIFQKNKDKIDWLKKNGHEIGWHHHAYILENGEWKQDINPLKICKDLEKYGKMARQMGIQAARMGWGFHTNKTMESLVSLGFSIDSSAIPRPKYGWELSQKDWSTTTQESFYPSKNDYRIGGEPKYNIKEIPINTVYLPLESDTEKVMRYINPSYHNKRFKECIKKAKDYNPLVLIMHPYEVFSNKKEHPLLSFNPKVFLENIQFLSQIGVDFQTISENNKTKINA